MYRLDKSAEVQRESFKPLIEILSSLDSIDDDHRATLQEELKVEAMLTRFVFKAINIPLNALRF